MMKAKWIAAAVMVAALTGGCAAFGHRSSHGTSHATSSSGGGGTIAEGDLVRLEEAANRAEAAANRAEAASERAALAAEKAESIFHKGLRK